MEIRPPGILLPGGLISSISLSIYPVKTGAVSAKHVLPYLLRKIRDIVSVTRF